MKKELKKLAVILAAVLLTACQNDTEPKPDITSGDEESTKYEISQPVTDIPIGEDEVTENVTESSEEKDFIPKLLMDTDKPFVRAEDHYIIEKQDIDVSAFNEYGIPRFVADGKYFYSEHPIETDSSYSNAVSTKEAYIYEYDSETGKYSQIYSEECLKNTEFLYFNFVALRDNYLYYFREESLLGSQSSTGKGFDLCRLNLDTKQSEHIFSLNNEWFWACRDEIDIIGNSLYFYDFHDANLDTMECVRIIYRFDFDTGEVSVFRDDADTVTPYKNGLVYCHDDGYYYHGEDNNIKGKGIFYEGDELLFYYTAELMPEKSTEIKINGDTIIYGITDYDSKESVVGFFDENYNQTEIASTKKGTWYFYVYSCEISESGLVYFDAPAPLIYDKKTDSFAVIPIDDYTYCYHYATKDGICIFIFSYADDEYTSAALYTVKRR